MSTAGYVQRLVARHAGPLALRPRSTPRVGVLPLPGADGLTPGDWRRDSARDDAAGALERARTSDGPSAGGNETNRRDVPRSASRAHDGHVLRDDFRPAVTRPPRSPRDGRLGAVPVGALDTSAAVDNAFAYGDAGQPAGMRGESLDRAIPTNASVREEITRKRLAEEGAHQPIDRDDSRIASRSFSAARAPRQGDVPDSVHVHIGRIEVRAVAPPAERASAPARVTGPEPLSLDSYLARRTRQ
jgi:hypothetical protein